MCGSRRSSPPTPSTQERGKHCKSPLPPPRTFFAAPPSKVSCAWLPPPHCSRPAIRNQVLVRPRNWKESRLDPLFLVTLCSLTLDSSMKWAQPTRLRRPTSKFLGAEAVFICQCPDHQTCGWTCTKVNGAVEEGGRAREERGSGLDFFLVVIKPLTAQFPTPAPLAWRAFFPTMKDSGSLMDVARATIVVLCWHRSSGMTRKHTIQGA